MKSKNTVLFGTVFFDFIGNESFCHSFAMHAVFAARKRCLSESQGQAKDMARIWEN